MNECNVFDLELIQLRVGKKQYQIEMALLNGNLRLAKYLSNKLLVSLDSRILALELVLNNSMWLILQKDFPLTNELYNRVLDTIFVFVLDISYCGFSSVSALTLEQFSYDLELVSVKPFIDKCMHSLILFIVDLWVKDSFSSVLEFDDVYRFVHSYKPPYFVVVDVSYAFSGMNLWLIAYICKDLHYFLFSHLTFKFKIFRDRDKLYIFVCNYHSAKLVCFYLNEYFCLQNFNILKSEVMACNAFEQCYSSSSKLALKQLILNIKFLAQNFYSPNSLMCNLSKILNRFSGCNCLTNNKKQLIVLRKSISNIIFQNLVRIYRFKYPAKGRSIVKYRYLVYIIRKYHWLVYTSGSIKWWGYHESQSHNMIFLFYP